MTATTMKPTCARILTVLRAGPARTGELCRPDVGGERFGARMKELTDFYGIKWDRKLVAPHVHLYWLVDDRPPLTAIPGGAEPPHIQPDHTPLTPVPNRQLDPQRHPVPRPTVRAIPAGWPGPWCLCTACSWTWQEAGHCSGCPQCGETVAWLEEHVSRVERDRRAREIDPAGVAEERARFARAEAARVVTRATGAAA